jgi:hypothetical protein
MFKINKILLGIALGINLICQSAILRISEPLQLINWETSTVISYSQSKVLELNEHYKDVKLSFVNFSINKFENYVDDLFILKFGVWGFSSYSNHDIILFILKDNASNVGWIIYHSDLSKVDYNHINNWYFENNKIFSSYEYYTAPIPEFNSIIAIGIYITFGGIYVFIKKYI